MPTQLDNPPQAPASMDDLAEIIRAYNHVTERLQESHEKLQNEVVRLRQELASTNAQLQRSKRLSALGEMAAGIAHEIRNPLGAIQLYVAMIIEDLSGAELRPELAADNARKVASAVNGLNAIVGDVLAFAKETRPQPRELVATEVFDRLTDAIGPLLSEADIQIARPCPDEDAVAITADPQLLHQALLNLARNAIEAMDRSDRRVLTLDASADQGQAVITLRDSGPGIAETDIDRIFNPFFTTRNTGTGLGLAIVHRIVDAHGGSIAVHNDPAEPGAVFRLFLPATTHAESAASGAHEVNS